MYLTTIWLIFALQAESPAPIPLWTLEPSSQTHTFLLPDDLASNPVQPELRHAILRLDKQWQSINKQDAFKLKAWIVSLKSAAPQALVALEANPDQINSLMEHELAPYIDGYVFDDSPYIPDADETGKLWLRVDQAPKSKLLELIDAAAIGIQLVIFEDIPLADDERLFLETIRATKTGSLDQQPELPGFESHQYHLFMDPGTGIHHLAISDPKAEGRFVSLRQNSVFNVEMVYPNQKTVKSKSIGTTRTEFTVPEGFAHTLFKLVPTSDVGPTESIQIVAKKSVDPYELVVKNQVFKDSQAKLVDSLQVEEEVTYRYQGPSGAGVDIMFKDTVIHRKDQATERVRHDMYLGGVKWPYDELIELPLVQPEKVQREPLVIDLDKSYQYTYLGEEDINDHLAWKVGFVPKNSGDFFTGTVWIDQENGAHHKIRAVQSGLQSPVIGNEVTAYYDWVEDDSNRYWTQVREQNLMVINFIGETVPIQLDSVRSEFKFNRPEVNEVLKAAYESKALILRDTDSGYKYLVNKGGERVLEENSFTRQRFLLGGILFDPGLDYPIPLAGFNYLNLDFMNQGYQFNALIGGALNVVHFANNDLWGKGWDLTAELFTTALYFSDDIYEEGERRDDLEVKELREAFNLSLGIPLGNYVKFSSNYSLRYLDYKDGDDTDPEFVLPSSTFEHIARLKLNFNRARFASSLEYETANRTSWEPWGFAADENPIQDQYSKVQFDASVTKRLQRFQSITTDVRYIKGWDLDRFSSIRFGGFENSVSGFGTTGIQADEAVRLRTEYEFGVKELFQMDVSLDAARAWANTGTEEVDLVGIGLAANFIGPWKLLLRANIGYGLHSTIKGEEGDLTGQIFLLRIF